jgi:hypothetical protein
VPQGAYLRVDPLLRGQWAARLDVVTHVKRRIGVAWKPGKPEHERDFKRSVPLAELVAALAARSDGAEIVALQPNDREQAQGLGVIVPAFDDFADVAAVASLMDMIVCADVAAINVAGAIGHGNAHVLLPYLSSWRWLGPHAWYPHVHRCQQHTAGDWQSALAQLPRDQLNDDLRCAI